MQLKLRKKICCFLFLFLAPIAVAVAPNPEDPRPCVLSRAIVRFAPIADLRSRLDSNEVQVNALTSHVFLAATQDILRLVKDARTQNKYEQNTLLLTEVYTQLSSALNQNKLSLRDFWSYFEMATIGLSDPSKLTVQKIAPEFYRSPSISRWEVNFYSGDFPIVSDDPEDMVVILLLRYVLLYTRQAVSKTTRGDGRDMEPFDFQGHDAAHRYFNTGGYIDLSPSASLLSLIAPAGYLPPLKKYESLGNPAEQARYLSERGKEITIFFGKVLNIVDPNYREMVIEFLFKHFHELHALIYRDDRDGGAVLLPFDLPLLQAFLAKTPKAVEFNSGFLGFENDRVKQNEWVLRWLKDNLPVFAN